MRLDAISLRPINTILVVGAIIFIPLSINSGNWFLLLLCVLYLLSNYYLYYLNTKKTIEISSSHFTYTSYNLLGKPIKVVIPLKEILNVKLVKMVWLFPTYISNILRGIDVDEPLLFRKRTEHIRLLYWDDHLVEKIEQALMKHLPLVFFKELRQ